MQNFNFKLIWIYTKQQCCVGGCFGGFLAYPFERQFTLYGIKITLDEKLFRNMEHNRNVLTDWDWIFNTQ